jgi:hypothetical protein
MDFPPFFTYREIDISNETEKFKLLTILSLCFRRFALSNLSLCSHTMAKVTPRGIPEVTPR